MRISQRVFGGGLRVVLLAMLLVLSVACPSCPPGTGTAGSRTSYRGDIQQIFRSSCRCHIENASPPGGLDLSTYEALMRGSSTGQQVTRALPESSNLFRRVSKGEMPPTGPLARDDIRLLREWIRQGARE
ncbi:MAG: c-type cytochrome domain-containing protein [candidate division WOR-3 bacterium]